MAVQVPHRTEVKLIAAIVEKHPKVRFAVSCTSAYADLYDRMEQALRTCTLWLWLDLRFPGIYGQVDEVVGLRSRLNDGIERQLKGKKPLWQMRQRGRTRR